MQQCFSSRFGRLVAPPRPWAAVLVLALLLPAARADEAADRAGGPRRPVALAVQETRLFVANARAGTISTIDVERGAVVAETPIGGTPRDLVALDGRWLLAVDDARHEALLLEAGKPEAVKSDAVEPDVRLAGRVAVARHPARVVCGARRAGDGRMSDWAAVSSLWSRRLTLLRIERGAAVTDAPKLRVAATLDLEFAPRALCVLPAKAVATVLNKTGGNSSATNGEAEGERLVVADAFGGKLLLVDPKRAVIVAESSLSGHNIGGLAFHPAVSKTASPTPTLLFAHQVLNSETSTTHEHVFWGGVVGNRLRAIELRDLLAPARGNEPTPGLVEVLGRPGAAAGDPGGIVSTRGGATVAALSGIHEIALRRRPEDVFSQRSVGKRPTAIALSDDEKTAWVLNSLDDSVSKLDLATADVTATISLGPPRKASAAQTLADRGEALFFDARLSLDGWYSCHSCHTDGHTNGLLNDNLGDEYFGAPKKVLTLLGTTETSPWAWNGKQASLESQIKKSLQVTMQADGDDVTDENAQALKAFLATLTPPPGIDVARGMVDAAAVERGRAVFKARACADCHAPGTYTTPGAFDVGVHDERGAKEFNPPSLRGVSQRAPYFHDNRATTLESVFVRFQHALKQPLSDADRRDLLAFLRSL